jgi:hypothetical protein
MDPISNVIVLLGGVRSGTTVFRLFLASHPNITSCGEIFNSHNERGFYSYFSSICASDKQAVFPENQEKAFTSYLLQCCSESADIRPVIDIKYQHLRLLHRPWDAPFGSPALLDFIKEKNLTVIHLRRNPVDAVISNLLAKHRGIYHRRLSAGSEASTATFTIDPKAFARQIVLRIKATRFVSNSFRNYQNYSQFDYETLFERSDRSSFSRELSSKLSKTLAVDDMFDHKPRLKKIIDTPRSSLISNYSAVEHIARKYENYFRRKHPPEELLLVK